LNQAIVEQHQGAPDGFEHEKDPVTVATGSKSVERVNAASAES
jgi:hypothetical protein